MAENYGFFDSMYDSSTGEYDRVYMAENFANYFKLFVGNGVLRSPADQLKVHSANTGLYININPGWAFINGYYYQNDSIKIIQLENNLTDIDRIDSVRLRMSTSKRTVEIIVVSDGSELVRNDYVYDLELASIIVKPNTIEITDSFIYDSRPDDDKCGFMKSVVDIENQNFVISKRNFVFQNRECIFYDERITENSLADVYFTTETMSIAEEADISVETYNGYVLLKANYSPESKIEGSINIRVV